MALFGRDGAAELQRNLLDYERNRIAPWTLASEGRDVGVGGFRLGFGEEEGFELTLSLLPGPLPVGLAGEFLSDAMLFARGVLRADRLYSRIDPDTALSERMLLKAGFTHHRADPTPARPDRRIMRWSEARGPQASHPAQGE